MGATELYELPPVSISRLTRLGIVFFEEEGQRKRPVVWIDQLVITLPFDPEAGDTAAATR